MGYLHIENLYRNQTILGLDEVYALEKVHGTSAHVRFKDGQLAFFSGEQPTVFKSLFDEEFLLSALASFGIDDITVNGEFYGGKCQGMSSTYGKNPKFIVFDVRFNGNWLTVPQAESVAAMLKMEFVHYVKISTKLEEIDRERDADSVQAIRNGMGSGLLREGIVLRPIEELVDDMGNRLIAKHKRAEFTETKTPRVVNLDKQLVLKEANAIAEEWVTPMRLQHVLSVVRVMRHMIDGQPLDMTDTGRVISAMIEDVEREAKGEILESREARTAIGTRTARLFKETFIEALKENSNGSKQG